jgi:hypothetical protein
MNVAITFKIADILEEKPEGMHISEIGKRAGIDSQKLGRILRLLATRHVFREGAPPFRPLLLPPLLTSHNSQSLTTFSPTIG